MKSESHDASHPSGAVPKHADVTFEAQDVRPNAIYAYLIGLAVAVIASYIICIFVLRVTTDLARESDTPPPPVRQQLGPNYLPLPPEPRLQGVPGHGEDPQSDLRDKIREDTAANEKFGWIDQGAGIAQIPVSDAMQIIAAKGLPDATAAPAEKKK